MTLYRLQPTGGTAAAGAGDSTETTTDTQNQGWWPTITGTVERQGELLGSQFAAGVGSAAAAIPSALQWMATTDPVSATAAALHRWTGGDVPNLPTPTIMPGGLVPPVGQAVENWINPVPPQGPVEQVEASAARSAGGAALPIMIGRGLSFVPDITGPLARARATGEALAAYPGRQLGAGAAVGAAQGAAAQLDADPTTQALMGLTMGGITGVTPGMTTGFASADRLAAGAEANARGWNIPPQKIVNSPLYQATAPVPFSGEAAANKVIYKNYATDAGSQMGIVPDVDGRFTPEKFDAGLDAAGKTIGQFYENNPIPLDPSGPVYKVLQTYEQNIPLLGKDAGDRVKGVIDEMLAKASANNGIIPADWLADKMRSKGIISNGAYTAGETQPFFSDLKEALQSQLRAKAAPSDVEAFDQATDSYRNIMTAAKVGAANDGYLPPLALDAAIRGNRYQSAAFTGGGELGRVAQLGKTFVATPTPTWKQGVIPTGAHIGVGGLMGFELAQRLAEAASPEVAAITAATAAGVPAAGALAHRALLGQRTMPPTPGEYYSQLLMNPNLYQPPQFGTMQNNQGQR